jgi:hypothetical protein
VQSMKPQATGQIRHAYLSSDSRLIRNDRKFIRALLPTSFFVNKRIAMY